MYDHVYGAFYYAVYFILIHYLNMLFAYSATSIIVVLAGTRIVLTPSISVFDMKSSPSLYSTLVLVSTC